MNRIRQFAAASQGLAVVEFALILPVLMMLFYGAVETTRFILVTQKAEKLAHTVADVTAQSTQVTTANLDQLMEATNDIMNPFAFRDRGRVIISSLYRAPNAANATVNWRYTGGGNLAATSGIGPVGSAPVLDGAFTFEPRENVIAAEVFFRWEPLVSSQFLGTRMVYRQAFYKPRFGALTSNPS